MRALSNHVLESGLSGQEHAFSGATSCLHGGVNKNFPRLPAASLADLGALLQCVFRIYYALSNGGLESSVGAREHLHLGAAFFAMVRCHGWCW